MAATWYIQGDFDHDRSYSYDLLPYVKSVQAEYGIQKPYEMMGSDNTLMLQVVNTDGRFNPENASSPYYGKTLIGSLVRCYYEFQVGVSTASVELGVGYIESIKSDWTPAGAQTGETFATIEVIGLKQRLEQITVGLGLYENVTGDEVVRDVLLQTIFPPNTGNGWLAEIPGFSEAGVTTYAGDPSYGAQIETGSTVFPILGDDEKIVNGWQAIKMVTEGERGRFFVNADGVAKWWNRAHLLETPASYGSVFTIDETTTNRKPTALHYRYDGRDIKNIIRATIYPRTIQSSAALWNLESNVTVQPGETKDIEGWYRDTNGRKVGAASVAVSGSAFSAGSASLSATSLGNRGRLTIDNSANTTPAILTDANLDGEAVQYDRNPTVIEAIDAESIGDYGRRTMEMQLRMISDISTAESIVNYELHRRKDLRATVAWLEWLDKGDNIRDSSAVIGNRITVNLTSKGHNKPYYIIGVKRDAAFGTSDGVAILTTRLFLEPAEASLFWLAQIAGFSEAGTTTYGGY